MTFDEIPASASVFLDANTLVYHFGPHAVYATACTELLERIRRQELLGITSAAVLSDVAHRLMILEAGTVLGWTTGATNRLKAHPMEISKLTRFQQAIQEVPGFGIQVLPITGPLVEAATALSRQHGLLSGDALIVAVMHQHSLTHLASHDADFDRVPGLTRYAPA